MKQIRHIKEPMRIWAVFGFCISLSAKGLNAEPYPIIFIHGNKMGTPMVEEGWKTWINSDNPLDYTALEQIIDEGYGGYLCPVECRRCDKTTEFGPNSYSPRTIFVFSYYDPNDDPGAIGSNGYIVFDGIDEQTRQDYEHDLSCNQWARNLTYFIDEVLKATGAEKVNIVTHCMGTLVARSAIAFYGCEDKVDKILMVAGLNQSLHGEDSYCELFYTAIAQHWQWHGEMLEFGAGRYLWAFEWNLHPWPPSVSLTWKGVLEGDQFKMGSGRGYWTDLLNEYWLTHHLDQKIKYGVITGDRDPWIYWHTMDDGVLEKEWTRLSGSKFNPTLWASHGDNHTTVAGVQLANAWGETSLIDCYYTTEIIKRWIIDGADLSNKYVDYPIGDPHFGPQPWWDRYELRLNLGLFGDPQKLLYVKMEIYTFLGSLAKILYIKPDKTGAFPVIMTSPSEIGSGDYIANIAYYDMNGLVTFKNSVSLHVSSSNSDKPYLTVLTPHPGEIYDNGHVEISWRFGANSVKRFELYYSTDEGNSWNLITELPEAHGEDEPTLSYDWQPPAGFYSWNCKVKVIGYLDLVTKIADESGHFTLVDLNTVETFTGEPRSSSEIKFTWTDNSVGEEGFIISYQKQGGPEMEALVPADEEENDLEEFILTGLEPNTEYWACIAAYYGDHVCPQWTCVTPKNPQTFFLPAPVITLCQPLSSSEIHLAWSHPFEGNPTKGFIILQITEGVPLPERIILDDPELREATLTVPYPSTRYTYQVIAFDGQVDHNESEPSDPASAFTHPFLSSRVPFSLDPSNSSKFLEKGDKVYLVHEDQDRVWLAIGTKTTGNIVWEDEEYLLSDLLPQAWDPCIGLLDIGTDTMLFCAFMARDG